MFYPNHSFDTNSTLFLSPQRIFQFSLGERCKSLVRNVYFPRGFSILKLISKVLLKFSTWDGITFKFSQHIIQHHTTDQKIYTKYYFGCKKSLGPTAKQVKVWRDRVNFLPTTLPGPSQVGRLVSETCLHCFG